MLSNYLKTAFRALWRQKLYSLINILGLSIGLATCMLILLYVQDELSFDQFHEKKARIYRVTTSFENGNHWAVPSFPVGPALKADYPEVEDACRMIYWGNVLMTLGDDKRSESYFRFVDPSIFEVLSFPLVAGDPQKALSAPYNMVLTETKAREFFGEGEAMGKQLTVKQGETEKLFTITGIAKDPPPNSSVEFNFLVPFQTAEEYGMNLENWGNWGPETYVLLNHEVSVDAFEPKIGNFIFEKSKQGKTATLHLQPISRVHLYPLEGGNGRITYVYLFSIIALFILLIACINFMNLTTARSMIRAREIGVRKVVGAKRSDLIFQFYSESILLSFIAAGIAIGWVALLLPGFNILAEKELTWMESSVFGYLLIITLVTGLLSGSYPALSLSSFRPVLVLKGAFKTSRRGIFLRKILVVTQFCISIILIICTLITRDQLTFIQQKSLGYDKDQVLYIQDVADFMNKYPRIKPALLKSPHIHHVTASSSLPTAIYTHGGVPDYEGRDPERTMDFLFTNVAFDYPETFGMEMAEGRSFSIDFPSDSTQAYLLNEEAVRQMELENPLGTKLNFWGNDGQVVGVVKDFHFSSFREGIEPLLIRVNFNWLEYVCIKLEAGRMQEGLAHIEKVWEQYMGTVPFDYHFVDESFEETFEADQKVSTIFTYFAYLGIFISCLGLLGLAAFMAQQRRKEIGIRKVMGASVSQLVRMLTREFTKLVVFAFIPAALLAFYFMHTWLAGFAYRTAISPWIFMLAGGAALLIAWLTVSWQSFRAASINPVEALRDE